MDKDDRKVVKPKSMIRDVNEISNDYYKNHKTSIATATTPDSIENFSYDFDLSNLNSIHIENGLRE